MKTTLHRLGSKRLTMAGFALLALGTIVSYRLEGLGLAAMLLPLALLASNLAAAIAVRPALRRGGLGLFHAALLALMLLAGWGRLAHFDGRVEVTEGTVLDPSQVVITGQGPWHGAAWRDLAFQQGEWEVDYAPRVWRARTRSQVWLPGAQAPQVVGDDTPLLLSGYRFYTTSNKGFAPILAWQAEGQPEPVLGALHMPSYPAMEGLQEQQWTAPDGRSLRFQLRLDQAVPHEAAWTLAPRRSGALLLVDVAGQRHELRAGETLALPGASLRFERLHGWMGYRIFYDPTLLPMFVVALLAVAGLAWHLWKRVDAVAALPQGAPA